MTVFVLRSDDPHAPPTRRHCHYDSSNILQFIRWTSLFYLSTELLKIGHFGGPLFESLNDPNACWYIATHRAWTWWSCAWWSSERPSSEPASSPLPSFVAAGLKAPRYPPSWHPVELPAHIDGMVCQCCRSESFRNSTWCRSSLWDRRKTAWGYPWGCLLAHSSPRMDRHRSKRNYND